MTSKKCLLDTNIVLDIIEKRTRFDAIKKKLTSFESFFISTTTFVNIFYILRKSGYSKEEIYKNLFFVEILSITKLNCLEGYQNAKKTDDVEDCIEMSLAKENNLYFVTADKKLAADYPDFEKIVLV